MSAFIHAFIPEEGYLTVNFKSADLTGIDFTVLCPPLDNVKYLFAIATPIVFASALYPDVLKVSVAIS